MIVNSISLENLISLNFKLYKLYKYKIPNYLLQKKIQKFKFKNFNFDKLY